MKGTFTLLQTAPKAAGILMIASAIGGLIAISAGYFAAGPLLLIAGILALLGNKNEQQVNKLKATAKSEQNALYPLICVCSSSSIG